MGKDFDEPVKLWRKELVKHNSECKLLSKVVEFAKQDEAEEHELVPKGLETINSSEIGVPSINPPVPMECVHDGNSTCSSSDGELVDLEKLMEETGISSTDKQGGGISKNSKTDEDNLREWPIEHDPALSEPLIAEVLNAVEHTSGGGVGSKFLLDGNNVEELKHQTEPKKPPLYQIIGDNVDLYVKVKHMASERQNKSIHWFAMNGVQDRVRADNLANENPIKPILEMENAEFLPSIQDNHDLLHDLIPVVARVLVERLPSFQCFKSVVVTHIPHEYSSQMKQKSTQVLC